MSTHREQIVQVWFYDQAPQRLKHLLRKDSEWVVLIPPSSASGEMEALFLRLHAGRNPVCRHTLADGSILFSGRGHTS
jgi:hypothetical protein